MFYAGFDQYCREVDFIRKWIFPGGFIPTLTFIMNGINQGSKAQLTVESVSNIGPHYARTLREWRQAFLEKFDDVIAPALKAEYPEIMKGDKGTEEAEVFKRKWICGLLLSRPDHFLTRCAQIIIVIARSDSPPAILGTISSHSLATVLKTTDVQCTNERLDQTKLYTSHFIFIIVLPYTPCCRRTAHAHHVYSILQ